MIAEEEKIKIDDKTLTIIAKKADGALRDAESYFDQVVAFSKGKIEPELVSQMLNLIDEEQYFNISDAVLTNDFKVVFQTSQKIYENGWDFSDFLEGLVEHFRNILSVVVTGNSNTVETADVYKARYFDYKTEFSESDLLRILNFLNKSQQELRFSQNQKLKIEIILSHLIALENSKTISDLISEVNSSSVDDNKTPESSFTNYKPTAAAKKKVDSSFNNSKKIETQLLNTSASMASPSSQPNISFDDIVSKWEFFIQSINAEKGLTLGPALKGFNLISLKDNNLYFSSDKDEDLNTFRLNGKYLNQKTEEIFGRRLNFVENVRVKTNLNKTNFSQKIESVKSSSNDPYEEFIVNELSGEKIA